MQPSHHSDRLAVPYRIYVCSIGMLLVLLSEQIAFLNSGDFLRTVGFMVDKPLDDTGRLWSFRADGMQRPIHFDASGYIFGLFGYLQKWTSAAYYDLRWHSIFAKIVLLLISHFAAKRLSDLFETRYVAQGLFFTLLSVSLFQAHNIGILKSFYGEYLAFLGCALLVLGLLTPAGRLRLALVLIGATTLGLAKVQYFYVPLLVLICMLWQRQTFDPGRKLLLTGLILAQCLCLIPLKKNPFQQLNYHQSTYFGSYLVMSNDELRALGLTQPQLDCVGLDSWGHKAQGPGGSTPEPTGDTCFGKTTPLTLKDVLKPYISHPTILWRLAVFSLPHHFTVQYFHVYRQMSFIVPADRGSYGAAQGLVHLTQWRDATISRVWPLIVMTGLLLGFVSPRRKSPMATTALFLALFICSQIVVSLLGEGIRDLSKHLWAAQLALDLLVILIGVQIILWLRTRTRKTDDSSTP